MTTLVMNTIQIMTTLFLLLAVGMFLHGAWKKHKNISNLLGNMVCTFFMACAIYLIWSFLYNSSIGNSEKEG